jgi:hypothetical protein
MNLESVRFSSALGVIMPAIQWTLSDGIKGLVAGPTKGPPRWDHYPLVKGTELEATEFQIAEMVMASNCNPWTTVVAVTWGDSQCDRVGAGRISDMRITTMDPMGWHIATDLWGSDRHSMLPFGCGMSYGVRYGYKWGDGNGNMA